MIKSFTHKGLERFFKTGSTAGIQVKHAAKLRLVLYRMNMATAVNELDFPGAGLHPLKGAKKGYWSLKVSGNWRVVCRFEEGDASGVDYVDYH